MKRNSVIVGALICVGFAQCKGTEQMAQEPATNRGQNQNQQRPQGPPNVNELFAKMDVNKDGKLGMEEVEGPLKNDFGKIDTNGDGFLSRAEIEAAPKPQGRPQPR